LHQLLLPDLENLKIPLNITEFYGRIKDKKPDRLFAQPQDREMRVLSDETKNILATDFHGVVDSRQKHAGVTALPLE